MLAGHCRIDRCNNQFRSGNIGAPFWDSERAMYAIRYRAKETSSGDMLAASSVTTSKRSSTVSHSLSSESRSSRSPSSAAFPATTSLSESALAAFEAVIDAAVRTTCKTKPLACQKYVYCLLATTCERCRGVRGSARSVVRCCNSAVSRRPSDSDLDAHTVQFILLRDS